MKCGSRDLGFALNECKEFQEGEPEPVKEAGKQAVLVIFNAENLAYLPYHFGINHVHSVFKQGKMVVTDGNRIY